MESVAIKGNVRSDFGTKAAKLARKENVVPCVIYGGENIVHFSAPVLGFKKLIYTPDFKLVEIEIDGKTYKCILKDMQFHPVTDNLLHMDFLELVDGQSLKVDIPIHIKGLAQGVKTGGQLYQKLRTVKIKTTPEYLVDELLVDVSELELGQSIRVRDIEMGEGMEMMTTPGIPVASVEVPRALRSLEAEEEEAAAAEAALEEGGEESTEGAETAEEEQKK
jgi:large subunit ribosomal protein L25